MGENITREDLIAILGSTGAVLAASTKLPADVLKKRVGQALDLSQFTAELLDAGPIDPSKFKPWTHPDPTTVIKAAVRCNVAEQMSGTMLEDKKGHDARPEDTFKETRQTHNYIYAAAGRGHNYILLSAPNIKVIVIRILSIYQIKSNIPLITIAYKELSGEDRIPEYQLREIASAGTSIDISTLERHMWLTLLRRNADRLAPGLQDMLDAQNGKDSGLYATFLLPLNPLNMESIGRLTKDTSCDVCHRLDASICVACRSAQYCSKECQTKDWPRHKAACKALRNSTWKTFTTVDMAFPFTIRGRQPELTPIVNTRDPIQVIESKMKTTQKVTEAPPEIGKLFLAKFQVPIFGSGTGPRGIERGILVYDRTRSFTRQWLRSSDPATYDEAARAMGSRGKFHRWVKRLSDNKFEVCLDNGPADPGW